MSDEPYNGEAPFVAGSDTSEAAARSLKDRMTLRRKVWEFIATKGQDGATDDEVEAALKMRHQTASARRRELVLQDAVRDSGQRRRTSSGRQATVWVAA